MDSDYNNYKESQTLAERIFLQDLNECKKFPKYFQIGTVNYCNAKCVMCPHRKDRIAGGGGRLSRELFDKIIEELSDYSDWIEIVALYWLGEPLLDQDIVYRVQQLHDIGIKVISISTNAECLSAEVSDCLFAAGMNDLRISMDGITKEVYESIRRGLHFEKVIENIHNAIRIRDEKYPGVPMRLRFVLQEKNANEWEHFKTYWERYMNISIDKIQFTPNHTKKEWSIGENVSRFSDVPCIALFSSMIIDSDGKVPLCCMDADRNEILGDVNHSSIAQIWQNKRLHSIRLAHLQGGRKAYHLCADCDNWAQDWKS